MVLLSLDRRTTFRFVIPDCIISTQSEIGQKPYDGNTVIILCFTAVAKSTEGKKRDHLKLLIYTKS